MSDLIRTGRQLAPHKILLYGPGGIGKSTFAVQSGAVVIPTEEGVNALDCPHYPECRSFEEVKTAIADLYSMPRRYTTLAIDGLSRLDEFIQAEVCRLQKVETIRAIGYGAGPSYLLPFWRELLDGLDALRRKHQMHIILIAHADISPCRNPTTETYDQWTPRLPKETSARVRDWCDEVLFASYRVYTTSTDRGFGRKEVKGVGGTERVIYTTERASHVAKNRLSMPDELPLSWDAVGDYLPLLASDGGAVA